ncbi:MAG: hypothetical protein ACLRX9_09975 [Streptococcus salivarius]
MKAEEWLTYFIKIYGRRPKLTEVDEAIQNGSLLANRVEVESLLLASKKSFWQTLSQYVVTHKVVASVLAVSCMTLLGGVPFLLGIPFIHKLNKRHPLRSLRQAVRLVKRLPQTSLNNRVPELLSRLQTLVLKVRMPHQKLKRLPWMWMLFEMVIFQASKVTGFLTVVML